MGGALHVGTTDNARGYRCVSLRDTAAQQLDFVGRQHMHARRSLRKGGCLCRDRQPKARGEGGVAAEVAPEVAHHVHHFELRVRVHPLGQQREPAVDILLRDMDRHTPHTHATHTPETQTPRAE